MVFLAIAVLIGLAAPASAKPPPPGHHPDHGQHGDPYGGTTTTAPAAPMTVSGELTTTSGGSGTTVTASIFGVPVGATVRVLFGGIEVGSAIAGQDAASADVAANAVGPASLFGGRTRPATATTGVEISFVVPDVAPGSYLVSAVGDDFTCDCSPSTNGIFSVVGASATGDHGTLPPSATLAGVLIAVAVALALAGRALVMRSRRAQGRRAGSASLPGSGAK